MSVSDAPRGAAQSRDKTNRRGLDVSLAIIVILLLWELLPRAGLVQRLFLPPFSEVIAAGVSHSGAYLDAIAVTAVEIAICLSVTSVVGIVFGIAIGSIALLNGFLAVVSAVYAVPIIAIYPVLCVWLGYGPEPRILLGTFFGVFPIILIVGQAARQVDPQLKLLVRSLGATQSQEFRLLYFPAVLPALFSAMRIGGGLAIIGVILGQMLLSSSGLGYLISYYRTNFDSASMYFAILLVILIIVLVDRSFATMRSCLAGNNSA
jgi:NitT/TauT family transport system permease protein/taurine transport system permease protein